MSSYKAEFFDNFKRHIGEQADKFTVDKENHLTRSIENTCLWAQALLDTFNDMGDVAGMLGMGASCDLTPLDKLDKK